MKEQIKSRCPSLWRMLTSRWYGVLFSSLEKEKSLNDMIDLAYTCGQESAFNQCAYELSRSIEKTSLYKSEEPFSCN